MNRAEKDIYKMKFSTPDTSSLALTFKGFLAVRLMEFDYAGKHYSYHGKKLENAVERLPFDGVFSKTPSTAELVVWGQAVHDWKEAMRTQGA